jgi:hypothetical protein
VKLLVEMKCDACPYALCNSQICHIKCEYKQEKSKKVKVLYKIPKVSKKRQVEDLQYKVLREEFLSRKENQICPISKQQTVEVHHAYSGKDRAKYYLDTTTWIAVSRDGHNWIHDHPQDAREQGYLK